MEDLIKNILGIRGESDYEKMQASRASKVTFDQVKQNALSDSVKRVRQARPNSPLSDEQIKGFVKQYGEKQLLAGDPGQPQQPHKENILQQALHYIAPKPPQVLAAEAGPTPAPNIPVPTGTDTAMNYIKEKAGGQDPNQYYKALQDPHFMEKIQAADKIKPGLANLLLMQAFNESTLGNANNGNNIFGALPGGEGSGNHAAFQSPSDAVDYQLGPHVLGGGGNPANMDVVHDQSPLTLKRVQQLYKSYNPSGDYLDSMLKALDTTRRGN